MAASCSTPSDGVPCPRREPAFRVELTVPGAAMPPDTTIEVTYQGSETETFSLTPGGRQNEDVCCRLGTPTSGVLPHVSCVKNPPPALGDASAVTAKDSGDVRPGPAMEDAAGGRVPTSDAGADARVVSTDGGRDTDASVGEPEAMTPRRTALFCELLTNGPATIHVTATGYRALDQELESKLREDNCGVTTVDVHAVLLGPDGGNP